MEPRSHGARRSDLQTSHGIDCSGCEFPGLLPQLLNDDLPLSGAVGVCQEGAVEVKAGGHHRLCGLVGQEAGHDGLPWEQGHSAGDSHKANNC